ncbi:hypothetical protein K523DRAFT_356116 [Schizophyllum commune Tattone D]|nr:hypothetical protein K523DRAFT_356116 [Schizophyllum commune Tattone D]
MATPATTNSAPAPAPEIATPETTDQPDAQPTTPQRALPALDTKDAPVPRVGTPLTLSPNSRAKKAAENRDGEWGANFWVTLIDPQTDTPFFACPATGEVSWDAPVGNFVLPPSSEGEWWELTDDTRGGIPYYYQTKTGETVWERPNAFVIPLGIIQNTALGRRLSKTAGSRMSMMAYNGPPITSAKDAGKAGYRRTKSYNKDLDTHFDRSVRKSQSTRTVLGNKSSSLSPASAHIQRRAFSNETRLLAHHGHHHHSRMGGSHLPPIPASPASSEKSRPPSSASRKSMSSLPHGESSLRKKGSPGRPHTGNDGNISDSPSPSRKHVSYMKPMTPQSLNAAVEKLQGSHSDSGHGSSYKTPLSVKSSSSHGSSQRPSTPSLSSSHSTPPRSTATPIPRTPDRPSTPAPKVNGKAISGPILNDAATLDMSPVKKRTQQQPIPVQSSVVAPSVAPSTNASLRTSAIPVLPHDLAMDIQQFSQSDYAKKYFSTHRRGFLFRRTIPVTQLMAWQKQPLTSPLQTLDRSLHKQAVRTFKVVQYIMGDREKDRHIGGRTEGFSQQKNASSTSLGSTQTSSVLEEERWLLGEGVSHPELRDEIYCQVIKQLTGNPNPESAFRGWQLICVLLITFPPSKNFESYLRSFIQQHTAKQEGRIDVMAKYCLRRLAVISKKGPRGKAPTVTEIETASDAAFNPSTFGESLDAIYRLQERNYPQAKVPIILPFLADGILALGGTKHEGIFRVPGDGDIVSELKLRIDRGFYTLDGIDDPHVLASLMKLWLRELCDPLVPEEMYNECITSANDPEACVRIVERLPTINRRVVLFVISFLQLFLDERTQAITKMTSANLALVMAPNLLRCNSESMTVVFTNAQFEQIFVHNLLLHLKCNDIDPDYAPQHGLGAVPATAPPRSSKSRTRRNPH